HIAPRVSQNLSTSKPFFKRINRRTQGGFAECAREFCAERADSQTLLRILGEIAEDFRAPLVLYYMEDLSYKEIADVLALPLGTVQSRIARAKIQLLRRLSETNLPVESK